MRASRTALLLLLLLYCCLSGCTGLFHSNAKPEQIYYLRAPAASTAAGAAAADSASGDAAATATPLAAMPVSLRVGRPEAVPGLDTAHIVLLQADHRMNFFSGSRWPAPVVELIESLTVQTLRASGQWTSVQDSGSPFPADYLLQVQVRRFEAEYTEGTAAPVVHVVLDCTVGRRQGREVLATFSVAGTAAAGANRLGEVVAAFEQASGTALTELAAHSAQAVRLDLQHAAESGQKPVS